MNSNTGTTLTGIATAIGTAVVTVQNAQDDMTYYAGLIVAILVAVQGVLTNWSQNK